MLLYHYSDILIKDKLTVDHYGDNYFTANDCKVTNIKRLFFYDKPKPELLLNGIRALVPLF